MARNVEIKAHIVSVDSLLPRVAALADRGPIEIAQDDTFFACSRGRIKLRAFTERDGELIYYRRADGSGPKESFYLRSPTASPDTLREVLALTWGVVGRVRKQRTLFMIGRTRVHLDMVEQLGHFLELEVVLEDDEAVVDGVREAHALMARLGIEPSQLVEGAYLDLLSAPSARRPG
jgi:predicted adenylyl cyclase CyaB